MGNVRYSKLYIHNKLNPIILPHECSGIPDIPQKQEIVKD